jgi:Zn-dependent peptidase ImmA (M78 family)
MQFLVKQKNGEESPALTELVANPRADGWVPPYEEGYELADELRDELGIEPDELFIDLHTVLRDLDIEVIEVKLDTNSIRGVAIAGDGFAPAIIINATSIYNSTAAGKRFTLAHELFHILYDRTRAKKISHLSGPWASARIEKRANAFAAMFLASTAALRKSLVTFDADEVHKLADRVGLGFSALVEHLFNVNIIGDNEREALRPRCH